MKLWGIENAVLMCLRQSRKQQADTSLNEPPDVAQAEALRRVTLSKIHAALPSLPERERLVLKMRYGLKDGRIHPQHEIAEMLGISRSYVSRVEKHGLELLRDKLME